MTVSDERHLELLTRNGPLVVVITGPSGVGKDSVLAELRASGRPYFVTVTATDRPRRPDEREGIDYFFLDPTEFQRMVEADGFLEHAVVYGQGKGIPRQQVRQALASGLDVLLRIDMQGAATISRLLPGCIRIFLAPPSMAELEERLRARDTESEEALQRRLAMAREELARADECDYLVVNADGRLNETVCAINAIIIAERARIHRTRILV